MFALRLEASKTRRVSTDRRECTKTYTTKAARNATPYCAAYKRRVSYGCIDSRPSSLFFINAPSTLYFFKIKWVAVESTVS